MNRAIATSRGTVLIREANLRDTTRYRELRLEALLDSPMAFTADYQTNLSYPMIFWEGRLTFDEHEMIFVAEQERTLVGIAGIRKGEAWRLCLGSLCPPGVEGFAHR
jgi:hypothetical protein